jgi:hypothetical protein
MIHHSWRADGRQLGSYPRADCPALGANSRAVEGAPECRRRVKSTRDILAVALKALAAPATQPSVIGIGWPFVFLDRIAAVDDYHLSGHIGCGFASKEGDSCGDFLRTAGAADRRILASDNFLLG